MGSGELKRIYRVNDPRNVTDEFKGWSEADIIAELDRRGVTLQIAIENLERDFNMGSIVRTANAFGVRTVHVIGRRQWNKRGAMATDRYLHVQYHETVGDFTKAMKQAKYRIVAIENTNEAADVTNTELTNKTVMVFGSEGAGISPELISVADDIAMIRQQGSTRSLNVAAAAAIAMYEWSRRFNA